MKRDSWYANAPWLQPGNFCPLFDIFTVPRRERRARQYWCRRAEKEVERVLCQLVFTCSNSFFSSCSWTLRTSRKWSVWAAAWRRSWVLISFSMASLTSSTCETKHSSHYCSMLHIHCKSQSQEHQLPRPELLWCVRHMYVFCILPSKWSHSCGNNHFGDCCYAVGSAASCNTSIAWEPRLQSWLLGFQFSHQIMCLGKRWKSAIMWETT